MKKKTILLLAAATFAALAALTVKSVATLPPPPCLTTSTTVVCTATTITMSGSLNITGAQAPANAHALCLVGGVVGHCTSASASDGSCTCTTP